MIKIGFAKLDILVILIPVAILLGGLGLAAFIWALRSGQYDDLEGEAERVLFDDETPPDSPTNSKN